MIATVGVSEAWARLRLGCSTPDGIDDRDGKEPLTPFFAKGAQRLTASMIATACVQRGSGCSRFSAQRLTASMIATGLHPWQHVAVDIVLNA